MFCKNCKTTFFPKITKEVIIICLKISSYRNEKENALIFIISFQLFRCPFTSFEIETHLKLLVCLFRLLITLTITLRYFLQKSNLLS